MIMQLADPTEAPSIFAPVLRQLQNSVAQHLGVSDVQLIPVGYEDRPFSQLLRVRLHAASHTRPDSHVFVKLFKPKPHDGGIQKMRARVVHDFETTRHIYESLSAHQGLGAVRPLACYPDHLAIVTEEAQGITLLDYLNMSATWRPGEHKRAELANTMTSIGRWLHTFQTIDRRDTSVSLDELRAYVDVRLERLVRHGGAGFTSSGRSKVLTHIDQLGRGIQTAELRDVIVHADLAPGNILVAPSGIVVLDFAMTSRGSSLHDISRLFLQLDLLTGKPQFRPRVVALLQRALLEGFDASLTVDQPLFRLLLLLHRLNHLCTLCLNRERFPLNLYNRHIRSLHRRWIQTELSRATGTLATS